MIARSGGGVETCCAKSEEKGSNGGGGEQRGGRGGGSGGCEAAVKRGRVRESRGAKPELACRVDTDREESRGGGRTEESEERTRRTEDGG